MFLCLAPDLRNICEHLVEIKMRPSTQMCGVISRYRHDILLFSWVIQWLKTNEGTQNRREDMLSETIKQDTSKHELTDIKTRPLKTKGKNSINFFTIMVAGMNHIKWLWGLKIGRFHHFHYSATIFNHCIAVPITSETHFNESLSSIIFCMIHRFVV